MRLGLTGGTGFIGQYLLKDASIRDQFVVLTSKVPSDALVRNDNIKYVTGTYTYESFLKLFQGCDAVVHLGAVRSSPDAEKDFFHYTQNIQSSQDLFRAAVELGISNIVNISSTAVYDHSVSAPFREDGPVSPLSFYGTAKLTIENIAHLYNIRHSMHIKSLRVAQALGIGERPGYMPAVFLQRCLNGEKLSVYGRGEAGKEYIYVKDIASAIQCAYRQEQLSGVFNIGTGRFTSNRELAETYCHAFCNKAGIDFLRDKQETVTHHYMDVEKAKNALGFTAKYSLTDTLLDMKNIIENGVSTNEKNLDFRSK